MHECAVRHGRARHVGEPAVAQHKALRQGRQDGKLNRIKAVHHLLQFARGRLPFEVVGQGLPEGSHEAVQWRRLGGDGRGRLGLAEQLLVGLLQAVRRTLADGGVVAALARRKRLAVAVSRLQVIGCSALGQSVALAQITKQMVERTVLQHEHDKMFKQQFCHGTPPTYG